MTVGKLSITLTEFLSTRGLPVLLQAPRLRGGQQLVYAAIRVPVDTALLLFLTRMLTWLPSSGQSLYSSSDILTAV